MKKAKSVMSIVAIVLAAVAALLLVFYPGIQVAMTSAFQVEDAPAFGTAFADHMQGIMDAFSSIGDSFTSFFSDGGESIVPTVLAYGVMGLGAVAVIIGIVALVMACVKKVTKALGWVIPEIILAAVITLVGVIALVPTPLHLGDYSIKLNGTELYTIMDYVIGAVVIVAAILFIIAMTFIIKECAMKKEAKEMAVKEETVDNAVKEVAAEPAAVTTATVTETTEPTKVVRRILVHRSGKVVRVLNEHYYDVTTNIYVEPGFVDASMPVETEQQHYERIINAAKEAPAPAPAPVAEPAPAPAPAPVVEPVPEKVKVERIPFPVRMKNADKSLKDAYNEIKSEILSYGLKSRISSTGDKFRLHTKTYIKIVIAGKSLKLYFALDPKDYKDSTFPIAASDKVAHVETPLIFKVKSDLSIRRAKVLIADCAKKDGLVQGEVVAHNHAKEVK